MKLNRFLLSIATIIFTSFFSTTFISAQDFMMQGWYWDFPKTAEGDIWADSLKNKTNELASAGFNYVWLPPLSRTSSGSWSNGYDPKDLYDLGEYGKGATHFGTRTDVNELITAFTNAGIKSIADVVYNHRDGGYAETNSAVENYIESYSTSKKDAGSNAFPYDRFRCILPIGGATGNGAGDYYFKISSASGHTGFNNWEYKVYMQTNTVGWQNAAADTESEPNGGGDCGEANNDITLGVDMNASVENVDGQCGTDEFHLSLSADDFNATGDTLFIYFGNRNSGYSDMRIYGIWAGPRGADIANELKYQTYTNFNNMPSGQGGMTFENFKPNNTNSTKLDGDYDWMWFYYDYDQNVQSTKDGLYAWTKWLWDDVNIRGYRMDAVKHFPYEFVGDLLDYLHDNSIDPGIVVGEFYDANSALLKGWIDNVYANMDADTKSSIIPKIFDFSLRDALEKACDSFGYDARNVFNASVVDAQSTSGFNYITFANNHDFRDGTQPLENEPELAYAYILTNNQVGTPCVFYPDYFEKGISGKIDTLISIHKNYIYGHTWRHYLSEFSTSVSQNFTSGGASTTLFYQLSGKVGGKDVLVAINFAGEELTVTHGINTTNVNVGDTFYDHTNHAALSSMVVDANSAVTFTIPGRSYAVWVHNQPLPVELTSFTAEYNEDQVVLEWETATEINNYGFEVQRSVLSDEYQDKNSDFETIGFVSGHGNSNSSKFYHFTDANPPAYELEYRLKQIDTDGTYEYYSLTAKVDARSLTDLKDESIPFEFELKQNYPNPFNPSTTIEYSIPANIKDEISNVELKIYGVLGNEITTLVDQHQSTGNYEVSFDADGLPSGIYFYQLRVSPTNNSEGFIESRKMILMK